MDTEKRGEGPLRPQWEEVSQSERIAPTPKNKDYTAYTPPSRMMDVGDWMCMGVAKKNFKLLGSEHELPSGFEPSQTTTDADSKWVYGQCQECNTLTVWKKIGEQV